LALILEYSGYSYPVNPLDSHPVVPKNYNIAHIIVSALTVNNWYKPLADILYLSRETRNDNLMKNPGEKLKAF